MLVKRATENKMFELIYEPILKFEQCSNERDISHNNTSLRVVKYCLSTCVYNLAITCFTDIFMRH